MRHALFAMAIIVAALFAGCDDESTPVSVEKIDTLVSVNSPCEDREAEEIALALARTDLAPQWLYDRIHNDLANIRAKFADSVPGVQVIYDAYRTFNGFDLWFDTSVNLNDSVWRHTVDSTLAYHGARVTGDFAPIVPELFFCYSDKRHYPWPYLNAFVSLPGLKYLENWIAHFDGSDMFVWRDHSTFKYFFIEGFGDCPSGCFSYRYSYFLAHDGQYNHVETVPEDSISGGETVDRPWFDTLRIAQCQKRSIAYWNADSGWVQLPDEVISSCIDPIVSP